MNIALTGFMGTGKSAVGKLVAEKLGWQFFDTDEIIEQETGSKISEIFAKKGELYFRELETKTIKLLTVLDKTVISCGGGVVLKAENMDELEKCCLIICLTAGPEIILERTKGSSRPLLSVKEPLLKIKEMLKTREPFYKRAKFTIDTSKLSVQDTVKEIIGKVLV
jgi:shikimate kinase